MARWLAAGPDLVLKHCKRFNNRVLVGEMIDEELTSARAGALAVSSGLSGALLVLMLRVHFEQADSSSGLLNLPGSPVCVKAVTAIVKNPPLGGVNVDGNKYNSALPYDTRFDTGNIDQTCSTAQAPSRDCIAKPAVEEDLGMPAHARSSVMRHFRVQLIKAVPDRGILQYGTIWYRPRIAHCLHCRVPLGEPLRPCTLQSAYLKSASRASSHW